MRHGDANLHAEQSGSVAFPSVEPVVLTFTDAPPAASDATLTLIATGGELNLGGKRLEQLTVDGASFETPSLPGGHPAGSVLPTNQRNILQEVVEPVTIPEGVLNGFVADGTVVVSVVRPGFIAGGTFDFVLSYASAIPNPLRLGWLRPGARQGFVDHKDTNAADVSMRGHRFLDAPCSDSCCGRCDGLLVATWDGQAGRRERLEGGGGGDRDVRRRR